MKRREAVAVQIRATLSNGGAIHGSTLTAWARELDPDGAYSGTDARYANRTYQPDGARPRAACSPSPVAGPEAR